MSGAGESTEGNQTPGPPPGAVSPPSQEREPYKKLGLTKQVLAAHTQKEEQAFLYRFRQLRGVKAFKANCAQYLEHRRGQMISDGKHDQRTVTLTQRQFREYQKSTVSFPSVGIIPMPFTLYG